MICVDVERIGVAQPDKVLFEQLSVTIASGDRVAVVGVNGSGKSTLLRILAGAAEPDEGAVRFGRGVRPERDGEGPGFLLPALQFVRVLTVLRKEAQRE